MSELKWTHLRHPREVGAMVEAQAKRWMFTQNGRRGSLPEEWPVVTISCEFGAHGVVLGQKVAERLGFSYWDREVVSEIARLLHMGEGTVFAFDERTRTAIEDLLAASAPNLGVTSANYVADVRGIIDAIAGQGSAVIVGREAQYLVDPRRALQVGWWPHWISACEKSRRNPRSPARPRDGCLWQARGTRRLRASCRRPERC